VRITARLAGQAGTDAAGDSRARQLHLTPSGHALLRRALADVEATDEDYFAALGNRRGAFLRALQSLA
jgi:DNA-binding MarR family transcriptional regulator